jgi:integrase
MSWLRAAAAVAGRTGRAPGRAAVLHHRRPYPRATVVRRRGSQRVPRAGRAREFRRRFAPHQLRHAHALELAREGVSLNIIQRQLGHANLGTTPIYLQGIDPEEIIVTVRTRRAPMISAPAGLLL